MIKNIILEWKQDWFMVVSVNHSMAGHTDKNILKPHMFKMKFMTASTEDVSSSAVCVKCYLCNPTLSSCVILNHTKEIINLLFTFCCSVKNAEYTAL